MKSMTKITVGMTVDQIGSWKGTVTAIHDGTIDVMFTKRYNKDIPLNNVDPELFLKGKLFSAMQYVGREVQGCGISGKIISGKIIEVIQYNKAYHTATAKFENGAEVTKPLSVFARRTIQYFPEIDAVSKQTDKKENSDSNNVQTNSDDEQAKQDASSLDTLVQLHVRKAIEEIVDKKVADYLDRLGKEDVEKIITGYLTTGFFHRLVLGKGTTEEITFDAYIRKLTENAIDQSIQKVLEEKVGSEQFLSGIIKGCVDKALS